MSKRLELMVASGPCKGNRFEVPEKGLRLGRSSANDIHLPDEELSRNHCLIEPDGETGIRIMDLASANGTFVNDVQLGLEAQVLKAGDVIVVGSSELRVVGEAPAPAPAPAAVSGEVDLGLGPAPAADAKATAAEPVDPVKAKRAKIINLTITGVAAALVVAIVYVLFFLGSGKDGKAGGKGRDIKTRASAEADGSRLSDAQASELMYERVDATPSRIVRYGVTIVKGVATLDYAVQSNSPDDCQKVGKSGSLTDKTMQDLMGFFDSGEWADLESRTGEGVQVSNQLKSQRMKLIRNGEVKDVLVENAVAPDAFARFCKDFENMINVDLAVSLRLRSAEECLAASRHQEALGDELVEKAEIRTDNLWKGINCLKRARNELEGLTAFYEHQNRLKEKIEAAEKALAARYTELYSEANQDFEMALWDQAFTAFSMIRDLIPDANDPRCADAESKLRVIAERQEESRKRRNR